MNVLTVINTFDGSEEAVKPAPGGRRRRLNEDNHERQQTKKMRYSGGGRIPTIGCKHTSAKCFCQADRLTPDDLVMNFQKFHDKPNKVDQDAALLHLMSVSEVKRQRQNDENRQKGRNVTVKYSLLWDEHPNKLPVCKATFLSVLGISKDRASRVARYYAETAEARPERRGGARNIEGNDSRRQLIINHIKTFTSRASHYGRRGAPGRRYLPADLSVRRMHGLFEALNHAHTSYSLYYSVFAKNFNLGFGHPATDACSDCAKYKFRITDPNMTEAERQIESASFILHRRRARVFYDLLGRVAKDSVSVCFDMMQNLILPKTPIGQAYYSRQLYLYLFGVVRHHGENSRQPKEDVHLYVWQENQGPKNSNMIPSALNDCFTVRLASQIRRSKGLRLFSDSCYGQNKNMTMVSMLMELRQTFPNLCIEHTFPVRGHSYLPADRVFGRIEQKIRRIDTILLPQEYHALLQQFGNVYIYGTDWKAFDYKSATKECVKAQRSFKISEARMLDLSTNKVGIKVAYNGEYCFHSVLKRGKRWADLKPAILESQTTVKKAKKQDVVALLKAIGVSEAVSAFYSDALSDVNENAHQSDEDPE
ncbi:uncharacterized protein LOC130077555 [Rhinichthys klamathensis goyatoka]|uniref:uncharacterized protein LOC130077555 n=1 Tax=Rhinichthys klamathensis goyatoka TaxID=3034132 RepID=UPI0024B4FF3C|nr:uncharacterized protein LOC130077555 [Rhinichthys klamathensis goyatoka]